MGGMFAWATIGIPTATVMAWMFADGTDWKELITATPIGAAMIVMVYMGIKYIERRDDQAEKRDAAFMAALKDRDDTNRQMGEGCHQVQQQAIMALSESGKCIAQNSEVLNRMENLLAEEKRKNQ